MSSSAPTSISVSRCRRRCRACRAKSSIPSTPGRTRPSSTRPPVAWSACSRRTLPSSKPRSTPKSAPLRRTSSSRRSNRPVKLRTIRNDEGGPRSALFVLRCAVRRPGLAPDLRRCLGLLEQNYRQSVFLAYYYGLSYEELAEHSSVPVGTIKTWIHRAVEKLQLCLSQ